jgi:phosphate transport system substrate-binding protein
LVPALHARAADITGAGATFPYPIYAKWAEAYKAKSGVGMNYQSIGSGGGIAQIKAKTVDFGASDMPLKQEDLQSAGLMQFPAIVGGVVPVVNLEGVAPGAIKLTGPVLADVFLGKIKQWNDKAIVALNPGVKLTGDAISVVHRSDGSGTTFIWTDYLAKVSPDWKSKVGSSTAVSWPEGVGGKGNEGVAAYVQRIKGSIGYVEYAYAKRNNMTHVLVQNKDGQFVQPSNSSFQAAAANADWKGSPGFYQILTDQPGNSAWPITGASFILMHAKQDKPQNAAEVLKFFDWSFRNGQKLAEELDYVPLPENVTRLIEDAWKTQIKDATGKAAWS